MLFAILFCFLLPIRLTGFFRRKGDNGQYFLDLLACFAGGVFLAAYLIFMAPSVRELILENLMRPRGIEYPLPDMLIGIGFFLLLLLNRVVITMSKITKRRKLKKEESKRSTAMFPESELSGGNGIMIGNGANGDSEMMTRESSANGIVLMLGHSDTTTGLVDNDPADATCIDINDELDTACPVHTNNPYPLPRRSSITDVAHQDSTVRSIIMMLALSLDSVLEGITTGLKTTTVEVWAIFIGNLVHETVIAFCLGLQLVRNYDNRRPVVIAAVSYSLMNPVGLLVATAIFESVEANPQIDLANGIFQALTSGCFIYVTFCEILEGQITHRTSFTKIAAMFAGYATLAVFAATPGSSAYSFVAVESKNSSIGAGGGR